MLREFSAGGVVFKKESNQVLWLVTKATPSKLFPNSFWRFPKGWLDDIDGGKNPGPLASGKKKATSDEIESAAIREVAEEAGVKAKVIKKVGTEKYFMNRGKGKTMKFVTYYLMEWIEDLPEGHDAETAEIAWLPFDEARKKLSYSGEKKILDKAAAILEQSY